MAVEKLDRRTQTGCSEHTHRHYRCGVPVVLGTCMQACHRYCHRSGRRFNPYNGNRHRFTHAAGDTIPWHKPLDSFRSGEHRAQQDETEDFRPLAARGVVGPAETPHRRPHQPSRGRRKQHHFTHYRDNPRHNWKRIG